MLFGRNFDRKTIFWSKNEFSFTLFDKILNIKSNIQGTLNNLNLKKLILSHSKTTQLVGDFNFRNIFGNEKQRGIYHYDSLVFPYIATAINKGKWNMSEYSNELDKLFGEYNINPFERGIV